MQPSRQALFSRRISPERRCAPGVSQPGVPGTALTRILFIGFSLLFSALSAVCCGGA